MSSLVELIKNPKDYLLKRIIERDLNSLEKIIEKLKYVGPYKEKFKKLSEKFDKILNNIENNKEKIREKEPSYYKYINSSINEIKESLMNVAVDIFYSACGNSESFYNCVKREMKNSADTLRRLRINKGKLFKYLIKKRGENYAKIAHILYEELSLNLRRKLKSYNLFLPLLYEVIEEHLKKDFPKDKKARIYFRIEDSQEFYLRIAKEYNGEEIIAYVSLLEMLRLLNQFESVQRSIQNRYTLHQQIKHIYGYFLSKVEDKTLVNKLFQTLYKEYSKISRNFDEKGFLYEYLRKKAVNLLKKCEENMIKPEREKIYMLIGEKRNKKDCLNFKK